MFLAMTFCCSMKLSKFKYTLPNELLADRPAAEREDAKLMVIHRDTGEIEHRKFRDVLEYFDDGDLMVMNDTKVFPARMYGNKEKTGARIEVFLLRELNRDSLLWDVLVDPARKIRIGNKLYFGRQSTPSGQDLYVYDISNPPAGLTLLGSQDINAGVIDIRVAGRTIFLITSKSNKEVQIWDNENLSNIKLVKEYNFTNIADKGMDYEADFLYVTGDATPNFQILYDAP